MAGNISVNTPAKINIGLNIVGKREDSFHNLETVFYPVGISDTIRITESKEFKFRTSNPILKSENDNLIIKAKNILEKVSGMKINAEIILEKNIPIGAGLGGGSSDAAAVLKTLNKIYGLNFSASVLLELALKLGSDVPFFINPVPSYAESRGEILEPLKLKIQGRILIVNPGIHVSTAWAFSKIKPALPKFRLKQIINLENYTEWREKITNDFEYPEVRKIKEYLYESGAEFALMTGSGSTLFAIYKDLDRAAAAEAYFKKKKYFTYLED